MNAIEALLDGIVDYAGLFPPAALPLEEAATNYGAYLRGPDRSALGSFVIPVSRVEELLAGGWIRGEAWPLSLLWTRDPALDSELTRSLARDPSRVRIVSIETRAQAVEDLPWLAELTEAIPTFIEFDWREDPRPWVKALGRAGLRAKIRTGGVEAGLIPPVATVCSFLRACLDGGVAFKATAGLHHPFRGAYPLTYETNAPRAMMHGFVNLFLAGLLYARVGLSPEEMESTVSEMDPKAFHLHGDQAGWRHHRVGVSDLMNYRRRIALSFGSCSFVEPLDDLRALEIR